MLSVTELYKHDRDDLEGIKNMELYKILDKKISDVNREIDLHYEKTSLEDKILRGYIVSGDGPVNIYVGKPYDLHDIIWTLSVFLGKSASHGYLLEYDTEFDGDAYVVFKTPKRIKYAKIEGDEIKIRGKDDPKYIDVANKAFSRGYLNKKMIDEVFSRSQNSTELIYAVRVNTKNELEIIEFDNKNSSIYVII